MKKVILVTKFSMVRKSESVVPNGHRHTQLFSWLRAVQTSLENESGGNRNGCS